MCLKEEKPEAGSQPNRNENSNISNNPCQKFGIALPTIAKAMATLSKTEYCFAAEIMPKTVP